MNKINKWINYYIKGLNIDKIEWINLDTNELNNFIKENYYDKDIWEYVHNENHNSLYPTLLGMTYLNIYSPINSPNSSFFLGIINNKIGKKTIVAATIYLDKYYIFTDQEKPITYISSMEVNSFLRNKGIFKRMCKELNNVINYNQHIVTSKQTEMGLVCKTYDTLKNTLISNGFNNEVIEDYSIPQTELHDTLCKRNKKLKK